jgi:hypothetical protein
MQAERERERERERGHYGVENGVTVMIEGLRKTKQELRCDHCLQFNGITVQVIRPEDVVPVSLESESVSDHHLLFYCLPCFEKISIKTAKEKRDYQYALNQLHMTIRKESQKMHLRNQIQLKSHTKTNFSYRHSSFSSPSSCSPFCK